MILASLRPFLCIHPERVRSPQLADSGASDFCSHSDSLMEVALISGIVSFSMPATPKAPVTTLKLVVMVSMRLP